MCVRFEVEATRHGSFAFLFVCCRSFLLFICHFPDSSSSSRFLPKKQLILSVCPLRDRSKSRAGGSSCLELGMRMLHGDDMYWGRGKQLSRKSGKKQPLESYFLPSSLTMNFSACIFFPLADFKRSDFSSSSCLHVWEALTKEKEEEGNGIWRVAIGDRPGDKRDRNAEFNSTRAGFPQHGYQPSSEQIS